jgi:hypothetical protein
MTGQPRAPTKKPIASRMPDGNNWETAR